MFDIDLAQRVISEIGAPARRTEEVPISKAIGRVLAEPIRSSPSGKTAAETVLDAGARVQSKHVPHLASTGRPTVRVFQKLKAGVLTLGAATAPEETDDAAASSEASLAGPMLASLLDDLGAVAIAAPRVHGEAEAVRSVLDMLLNECSVVLVAGCVPEMRHRQMRHMLCARGATFAEWKLCDELGAKLCLAMVGDKIIVCLPHGLAEAFMAFMLLISPLIRRLQGRTDLLPASHAATVRQDRASNPAKGQFLWTHETEVRSELSIHPHCQSSPIDAIAQSDGIARSVAVSTSGEIVDARHYPFSTWLR